MNKHAVYHITDVPFAYPLDENTLELKIRIATGDIKKIEVFYKDRYDFENEYLVKEMEIDSVSKLFTFFKVELKVFRNRYRYFFRLTDKKNKVFYFDERGIHEDLKKNNEVCAFQYAYIGPSDVYNEHKFLSESVVYQIFPERFYNGDKSNDPKDTVSWGNIPTAKTALVEI